MVFDLAHLAARSRGQDLPSIAQTPVFATVSRKGSFHGLMRCTTVLLYQNRWRQVYAMLIGYPRVSSNL
jgi:hypothetical protein